VRPRIRRSASAVVAASFLLAITVVAMIFWLIDPGSAESGDLANTLQGPSADHWLGTDHLGRDELIRLIAGIHPSLFAGVECVAIAVGLGVPLGVLAGYHGGWLDRVTMRVVDVVYSIPAIVAAIAFVAATGPGLAPAMFAVGLVFAGRMVRLARGEVLSARQEEYVDAARAVGAGHSRVIFRHIVPNLLPPILVQTTVVFAAAVVAEATLSFLGLGVTSPTASWGVMLNQARDYLDEAPLLALWPGIAIFLLVLAFNRLSDEFGDRRLADRSGGSALGGGAIEQIGGTALASTAPEGVALAVERLSVTFPDHNGGAFEVVSDVSVELAPGEILGLVGESGCGKSTLAGAVLGLVPQPARLRAVSIRVGGHELSGSSFEELRRVRGRRIALLGQEPWTSLNPAYPALRQVAEPLRWHFGLSRTAARDRAAVMLERVGVGPSLHDAYPHQLSGGEAQRVALAMALVAEPEVLIADEPTTALDAVVQREILDLIDELCSERGLSVLLITHDFAVVAAVARRVAVMYAGQIVETGEVAALMTSPRHPYTAGLLASVRRRRPPESTESVIPGRVPPPWDWPTGCRFVNRCAFATAQCSEREVSLDADERGAVRCVWAGSLHLAGARPTAQASPHD
jgi:peptide/nickel transport system permease protein